VLADWVIYPVYASFAGRWPRPVRLAAGAVLAAGCLWATYALIGRFSVGRFIG